MTRFAKLMKNKYTPCSIVIRCYNEEKHIGKLLFGLLEQNNKQLQIIVVDSGSTDSTLAIVKRFPVELIQVNSEEFSFGRSLNRGCAAANADYIVIASAHVYPIYRNWIDELLSPFRNSRIGLVYGKQQGGESTKYSEQQIFSKWFPDQSVERQNHPFCNNANAAIRRELWEKIPYDEDLTGLEDIDWANRVMKAGFQIAYNGSAVVTHLHDESFQQIFNRYRREAIALKRIFPDETFKFFDFVQLFLSNTISDYLTSLHSGVSPRSIYEIPMFRLMQFLGTYHGFKEYGAITSQLKKTFYFPNTKKIPPQHSRGYPINPQMINYQSTGRSYRENR